MPQLDFISFLNQIFWLCLVFIFFYLFVFKNLIPFLSRVFKIRFKKLDKAFRYIDFLRTNDLKNAKLVTESLITSAISKANILFVTFSNRVNCWVNSEILSFNTKSTKLNSNYLSTLNNIYSQGYLVNHLIFLTKGSQEAKVKKTGTPKKGKKLFFFIREDGRVVKCA